jgi:hypothetical protein
MEKSQEKPHKFDIGEGYGIWMDLNGTTHRSFPDVFYRAKPGDSVGKYKIGDLAIMNQPTTKRRFGMFLIANVETGDFGGTGLKYKLTVHPYGTPEDIGRGGPPPQQADNSKKKEPKMKRPTYKMQRIKLADCKPHADAEAYSASTEDRAALSNSIGEAGILSPIAVIPDEDAGAEARQPKWFVIDGIGRMNALIAAGETETEAQVFDLGDLTVAEFVVCKNAMMRKVTTGTRVMAYLKCHEREVLAAADPEKYQQRPGNGANFKPKHHAVSRDTAWNKGWSAKAIAERIGVSNKDVLAGIELLKETVGNGDESGTEARHTKYEQMDLFETMDSVMHGETPIRRWKAAACGKVSKVGGKAAADYVGIGARTMVSLIGLFENWQTVPMESRGLIVERFRTALGSAPEDFRAVIEDWVALTEKPLLGKGKGKRR